MTTSSNLWSDLDINLYEDALSLLLEDESIDINEQNNTNIQNYGTDSNQDIKFEGDKELKKRKYNPDSDVIAQAVDETLYSLEIDPNSKEGKKKKRQIRNRLSAQFHRDRKNEHIRNLEIQIDKKDKEIEALKTQINFLISENTSLVLTNNQSYLSGLPVTQQYTSNSIHSCINYASSTNSTDRDENSSDNCSIGTNSNNHYQQNFSTVSDSFISPNASPLYSFDDSNSVNTKYDEAQTNSPLLAIPRYGTSISVPGLARPLSMITMLCMVSIMLFNQTPVTDMNLPLQYQPKQPVFSTTTSTNSNPLPINAAPVYTSKEPENEVSFISRYLQSLNIWPLAQIQSPLTTMDEVQESELNTSMQLTTTSTSISRRLSEAVVQPNPSLEADKQQRSQEIMSNMVSVKVSNTPKLLPNVILPFTTTSTTTSGTTTIVPAASHSDKHVSPHRNLRSTPLLPMNNTTLPARNSKTSRNIVFSSGLINNTYTSKALSPSTIISQSKLGRHISHSQYQQQQHTQQREPYNWPASTAFDYNHNIHSYSEIILTQGKALLDPSLMINNKNILPRRYKRNIPSSSNEETAALSVLNTKKLPHQDTTNLDKALVSASLLDQNTMITNAPTTSSVSNNPLSTHFLLTTSLPSLPMINSNSNNMNMNHHDTTVQENNNDDDDDDSIDDVEHIHNQMNFVTLQLPASSIRVGKSWSNSEDGTLQSIMEVFNMTVSDTMMKDNNNDLNSNDTNRIYSISSADASVEISCIIVGAKIIIRDTQ